MAVHAICPVIKALVISPLTREIRAIALGSLRPTIIMVQLISKFPVGPLGCPFTHAQHHRANGKPTGDKVIYIYMMIDR